MMNIHKIIREEVDDLSWVESSKPSFNNIEMEDKLGVPVFDFEESDGELLVNKIEPYVDEEYEDYKKEMNESDDFGWFDDFGSATSDVIDMLSDIKINSPKNLNNNHRERYQYFVNKQKEITKMLGNLDDVSLEYEILDKVKRLLEAVINTVSYNGIPSLKNKWTRKLVNKKINSLLRYVDIYMDNLRLELNESDEDDFDWVINTGVFDSTSPWVIKYTSMDEALRIQDYLFSQGWGWTREDGETGELFTSFKQLRPISGPIGFYFSNDVPNQRFDGYSGKVWDKQREREYNEKLSIPSNEYTLNQLLNINESDDDLTWMDEVGSYMDIHFILNKQLYYRKNNWSDVKENYPEEDEYEVPYSEIELGPIRKYDGWSITRLRGGRCTITLDGGGELYDVPRKRVEYFVNSGVWAIVGDEGHIINESEENDLDWMMGTVDVTTFFIPGKYYLMGKLTDNTDTSLHKFKGISYREIDDEFSDGRGTLEFSNGSVNFSPRFIETMLLEKGLDFSDLSVDESLNESEEDDFGWAKDIQPDITGVFDDYFHAMPHINYLSINGSNNPNDKQNLLNIFSSSSYNLTPRLDMDDYWSDVINDREYYLWVTRSGNIIDGEIEDLYDRVENDYGSEYLIPREVFDTFLRTRIDESTDDLSWMDNIPTELTKDTIHLFYDRPFYTSLADTKYHLRSDEREKYTMVCWKENPIDGEPGCAHYTTESIVVYFEEGSWYWID